MVNYSGLQKALVVYGKASIKNLNNLKTFQENVIANIAEGNGAQVISGSGNGLSFTVSNSKLSNGEWFECLTFAIREIERNTVKGKSKVKFI